ncbi:hypothetical protein R4282_07305 [Rhodococcus oxybenzonivorans]|uniref:hypothetical protein n=1 Tax=Rhodococcus oxybenzonivorans TaxID=1990687 RepID=UPI002952B08C|nr:hypothetical protein [Rhodococcus oxybenzonivorans]MDV7352812.1 hypothetical protein [Rhodococcus oxybenzonivorans]
MAEQNNIAQAPVRELVRDHRLPLFQVFGVGIALNAAGYMTLTYIGIHLVREGGYNRTSVAWTTALVVSLIAVVLPAAGALVDKWGSTRVGVVGMIYSAVLVYPAMLFMEGNGLLVAGIAFFVLAMGVPLVQASAAPLFPALLDSRVRLTGVALGFNLSTILAGGTAAYIATWLIDVTGDSLSPAYFLITASIIGLATMATLRGSGYGGAGTFGCCSYFRAQSREFLTRHRRRLIGSGLRRQAGTFPPHPDRLRRHGRLPGVVTGPDVPRPANRTPSTMSGTFIYQRHGRSLMAA